jgi:hypothetical protein
MRAVTDEKEKPKKFTLLIPPQLHAQLGVIADEELRSLHAQILVILRDAAERRSRAREDEARTLRVRMEKS